MEINTKPKIIKFLGNIGENTYHFELGKNFLDKTPENNQ